MIDRFGIEYTDSEILEAVLDMGDRTRLGYVDGGWYVETSGGSGGPSGSNENIVDCLIDAGLLHDKRRK
jgi:hypothetical protein